MYVFKFLCMINFTYSLRIILVFLLASFSLSAQTTKIRGKILEGQNKEPLPFVTIQFCKTSIGTITDFNGDFFLETREKVDSVKIQCVGYQTIVRPITRNSFQTMNLELSSSEFQIAEITVRPGENPAYAILRKVTKNKDINSPEKLEALQYSMYNKMEIDLNNISESYKKKRIFNQFDFIWDFMDTSAETGKNYLPVFISETMSDYYYRKSPRAEKEFIIANKISGVENESVTKFTGDIYQKSNIYNNYINVFGKNFISPIASIALLYYEYYLLDSSYIDNQWCYHMSFRPRRKQELTFKGDFWIHDTTFAMKKFKIRLVEDANINFVNDLVVEQEYKQFEKQAWLLKRENVFIDFNITDSTSGFFARRSTFYSDFVLNTPKTDEFYAGSGVESVIVNEDALKKDAVYWDKNRPDSLSKRELGIYKMIDTIQEVPVFRTYVDIITIIVSGYKQFGHYFEVGPYPKLYSFNKVEGHRLRFGGRTSLDFSDKLFLDGYVAYGFKDDAFKYSGSAQYYLKKNPAMLIGISYKDDLEQFGTDPNSLVSGDNLLASVFSRNSSNKLNRVREFKTFFEKEWFAGFSNRLTYQYRTIYSYDSAFVFKPSIFEKLPTPHIHTGEIIFNTRFAYREKFVIGSRSRTSLGTTYPILKLAFTFADKNFLKGQFQYQKIDFSLNHYVNNPFGETDYTLRAGIIFGTLPYPLLKLHEGNETYWYNNSFNLMNYYEFVSDKYMSAQVTQHFEGIFLNKIPLLRKLKLREVAGFNAVMGDLSSANQKINSEYIKNPYDLSDRNASYYLTKPYMESFIGIENIFKILRVDMLWRMAYLNHPNIQKVGLRATFQIIF